MSAPSSSPDSRDALLAEFVRRFDESPEASAVLADFCVRHPELAEEFRSLANANRLLCQSGQASNPAIPERLGEFRVLRRVGQGGMGEVYEAIQESLGRRVAVKIIRQGHVSPDKRERFLREQMVLARLHQTHIVPIHTAGEEGPLQYFAMPYIEGAALNHVIRFASSLSWENTPSSRTLAELAGLLSTGRKEPERSPAQANVDAANRNSMGDVGNGQGTASCSDRERTSAASKPIAPETNPWLEDPITTAAAPVESFSPKGRPILSMEYYRSVAEVMADAAEAVEHAHGTGILHRDLKPSNIMVDKAGGCWLIDFGLAAFVNGTVAQRDGPSGELPSEPVTVSGLLGTRQYMAPEQCAGKADPRTDVWGLGVTLYELLTLRRAFDGPSDAGIREKILTGEPDAPTAWVADVPVDLAAICRKSLRKDASERYSTAADFAADLRRWLRFEPTMARPARTVRRLALWSRRNKGWAAAIVLALAAGAILAGARIIIVDARAEATANELAQSEERERLLQRESLIQKMIALRMKNHGAGWSNEAWSLAREAAKIKKDENLRDQAAAILVGADARMYRQFRTFDVSRVVFDNSGKRLLIGGANKWGELGQRDARAAAPARVYDLVADQFMVSDQIGPGPVAFGADGTPFQLVVNPRKRLSLWLWDVARNQLVREFKIPAEEEGAQAESFSDLGLVALSVDGKLVAASAFQRGKNAAFVSGTLLVWNAETGKTLRKIKLDKNLSALAINGESGLLVTGSQEGQITLWSLDHGGAIALPTSGRNQIACLALHRAIDEAATAKREKHWLLAAGDTGGNLAIWDLDRKVPRAFCRSSQFGVYAVTFSPDGATLASGGRSLVSLWDVATGRSILILSPDTTDFCTHLAFSADGKRLAASGESVYGPTGGFTIFDLEYHRGVQSLRGLIGQVRKVHFSPGARHLAALSDDWQVGMWDLKSGFLRHLLNVLGSTTDNAALAFSPDNERFAFASGTEAKLWNLTTGAITRWTLPWGLHDALAFDRTGKRLLLCRVETERGVKPSVGDPDPADPFVCRVRDLLGSDHATEELAKIGVKERVTYIEAAPDASYFAVVTQGTKQKAGLTSIFAGFSARLLHAFPSAGNDPLLDPAGKVLCERGREAPSMLEMPSGKLLESWSFDLSCLSPGALYWGRQLPEYGFALGRRGDGKPAVTLGIDFNSMSVRNEFSDDGRLLAWGNANGTVCVCDIQEVQHKLAEIGLDWE